MNAPEFSREQLIFLQETLSQARVDWFNKFEDSHTDIHLNEEKCYSNYMMAKELRNLFYNLGQRDTLAVADGQYHEQRLDQGHNR